MELFQRQPGVAMYSQWIGTNFIVAFAYDDTIELTEFGIPFAKIPTGNTDHAIKAIGQYIKTHKSGFHDLTSDEWQAIISGVSMQPKVELAQKAMF